MQDGVTPRARVRQALLGSQPDGHIQKRNGRRRRSNRKHSDCSAHSKKDEDKMGSGRAAGGNLKFWRKPPADAEDSPIDARSGRRSRSPLVRSAPWSLPDHHYIVCVWDLWTRPQLCRACRHARPPRSSASFPAYARRVQVAPVRRSPRCAPPPRGGSSPHPLSLQHFAAAAHPFEQSHLFLSRAQPTRRSTRCDSHFSRPLIRRTRTISSPLSSQRRVL